MFGKTEIGEERKKSGTLIIQLKEKESELRKKREESLQASPGIRSVREKRK